VDGRGDICTRPSSGLRKAGVFPSLAWTFGLCSVWGKGRWKKRLTGLTLVCAGLTRALAALPLRAPVCALARSLFPPLSSLSPTCHISCPARLARDSVELPKVKIGWWRKFSEGLIFTYLFAASLLIREKEKKVQRLIDSHRRMSKASLSSLNMQEDTRQRKLELTKKGKLCHMLPRPVTAIMKNQSAYSDVGPAAL
jgi:hypothetical protein